MRVMQSKFIKTTRFLFKGKGEGAPVLDPPFIFMFVAFSQVLALCFSSEMHNSTCLIAGTFSSQLDMFVVTKSSTYSFTNMTCRT